MASEDDTFDPNDLDSIDALLDEAEKDASESVGEAAEPDQAESALEDFDLPELEEGPAEEVPEITEIEEDLPEPEPEPELDSKPEPVVEESILDDVLDEAPVPPVAAERPAAAQTAKAVADPEEEFIARRAQSTKASKNEVSAAEMDSIKKLIIIFGSVLIVLVLTAIGMGIWSALAASSGLGEETQTMIEDIKAGTEKNTMANSANSKTVKSVEKKLDALSFQLEQLTADITALEGGLAVAATQPVVAPVTATKVEAKQEVKPNKPVVSQPQSMVAAPANNHEVIKKLSVVSSKMAKAQKRIDEVNKRVKNIQGQYSKLLHSVKVVEKQLVDQQAKEKKAEEEAAKKAANPRYQYSTPDAVYYDQSNLDSYP